MVHPDIHHGQMITLLHNAARHLVGQLLRAHILLHLLMMVHPEPPHGKVTRPHIIHPFLHSMMMILKEPHLGKVTLHLVLLHDLHLLMMTLIFLLPPLLIIFQIDHLEEEGELDVVAFLVEDHSVEGVKLLKEEP